MGLFPEVPSLLLLGRSLEHRAEVELIFIVIG